MGGKHDKMKKSTAMERCNSEGNYEKHNQLNDMNENDKNTGPVEGKRRREVEKGWITSKSQKHFDNYSSNIKPFMPSDLNSADVNDNESPELKMLQKESRLMSQQINQKVTQINQIYQNRYKSDFDEFDEEEEIKDLIMSLEQEEVLNRNCHKNIPKNKDGNLNDNEKNMSIIPEVSQDYTQNYEQFRPEEKQSNSNENNSFKNSQYIPHSEYQKISPEMLKTIWECIKKCSQKYKNSLALYDSCNYIKALELSVALRNNWIKLNSIINDKKAEIPVVFRNKIQIKINEKIKCANQSISWISPKAAEEKANMVYNRNNDPKNRGSKMLLNSMIADTKVKNTLNSYKSNMKQEPNEWIKKQKSDDNNFNIGKSSPPTDPSASEKKKKKERPNETGKTKKSIHDIEADEFDAKIESEIMVKNPNVKFSDIIGMKDLKQIIYEIIIIPTIRPDLFTGILRPQRGLLLFGPPGTGKTMIAQAIASECKSTFFNISASSLTSKWVGESEKTVRTLFKIAYKKAPSIIFIDEIDSILSKRSDSDNEASKRLKTEFLVQFDGLGSSTDAKLLVIAATNRPQDLDDALLRRLPKRVYCSPLDYEGRINYIKKWWETVEYKISNQDIEFISKQTDLYSNSDLKELCREAAYEPVRELRTEEIWKIKTFRPIYISDFKKALRQIRGTISDKCVNDLMKWNQQFGAI